MRQSAESNVPIIITGAHSTELELEFVDIGGCGLHSWSNCRRIGSTI